MAKYRVNFGHEDDTKSEESGIRYGTGTIVVETPRPIETDDDKYEVARSIGQYLGKTTVAIQTIIPLETGHVVIDASDYGDDE